MADVPITIACGNYDRTKAIIDGRVVPVDWLAVIFNPSFPYRLTHTVLAAFMATALFVCGVACARSLTEHGATTTLRAASGLSLGEYTALVFAGLTRLVR